MKLHRSTVNRAIDQALTVTSHYGIALPPWARWTPDQWAEVAHEPAYDEIRDCMLGWDVTDFGSDDFENIGRVLFTLRNGRHGVARYAKTFGENGVRGKWGQGANLDKMPPDRWFNTLNGVIAHGFTIAARRDPSEALNRAPLAFLPELWRRWCRCSPDLDRSGGSLGGV